MMNDYEYIEMYATKEQLEELKQLKQKVNNIKKDINNKFDLNCVECHFINRSIDAYICDAFINLNGKPIG